MNQRRTLIVLFFTPITGLFLLSVVTAPLAVVLAIQFDLEINGLLTVVPAFIGAFFINKAIYDSVFKPASQIQEESMQMTGGLIAKSMLYGVLGSIAPYFLAFLVAMLINSWDPDSASDIAEVAGLLGALACLPTIIMGAIMGALFVWLVVKLERPRPIFIRIEHSTDSRWFFLVGFLGGFLAGPILGMLAVFAAAWSGTL